MTHVCHTRGIRIGTVPALVLYVRLLKNIESGETVHKIICMRHALINNVT